MKKKIFILGLISIALIGFTISYFSSQTNIENTFSTKMFSTTLIEHFISPTNWKPGETVEKTIYVYNNGLNDVAVRLFFREEWVSSDNTVLTNIHNDIPVAVINFSDNGDWIKDGDYYYYKYLLKPNSKTSSFIDSVTFNEDIDYSVNCVNSTNKINCKYSINDYENATYKLTLNVEIVQYSFYKNAWDTSFEISNSEENL